MVPTDMFMKSGYQGWAGQWGTTKIPIDFSSLIFYIILGISEKGGNAYQNSVFQEMVKAFMAMASGSLSHEQYLLHFALTREANKSIEGVPKACTISWKAELSSSHSVSGLDSLEPSSAVFSFEAMYSAKISSSRSMHHSQICLARWCKSKCSNVWFPPFCLYEPELSRCQSAATLVCRRGFSRST